MASYESFAEVYDIYMDNVPYDVWCANLQALLKRYHVSRGIVAELGCGTGKMTRRMQRAGYDMIGIDNSCEMLGIAMEKGPENILYLCQDMRDFELYGTTAAMISVCDSMNYLLSLEDMIQVLKLVNNYLDPQGVFIFDVNTCYKYKNILGERIFAENRENGSFIWENDFDESTGINAYDLTLYIKEEGTEQYRRFVEEHFQRAFTMEEIKQAIEAAGMTFVEMIDVETMESVEEQTQRMYVVCREKGKGER